MATKAKLEEGVYYAIDHLFDCLEMWPEKSIGHQETLGLIEHLLSLVPRREGDN